MGGGGHTQAAKGQEGAREPAEARGPAGAGGMEGSDHLEGGGRGGFNFRDSAELMGLRTSRLYDTSIRGQPRRQHATTPVPW